MKKVTTNANHPTLIALLRALEDTRASHEMEDVEIVSEERYRVVCLEEGRYALYCDDNLAITTEASMYFGDVAYVFERYIAL